MLEWGNSGASESGGIEFWWSIYFIFLVRQAQTRASPLPPPFRVLAAAVDKLNPSPLFCSFFLIISILYPYPCCTGSSRQSVRRYGRFSSPQVIGYTPHARSPTLIEPGEASADYTYCIQVFPSGKASTVSYRTIIHSTLSPMGSFTSYLYGSHSELIAGCICFIHIPQVSHAYSTLPPELTNAGEKRTRQASCNRQSYSKNTR